MIEVVPIKSPVRKTIIDISYKSNETKCFKNMYISKIPSKHIAKEKAKVLCNKFKIFLSLIINDFCKVSLIKKPPNHTYNNRIANYFGKFKGNIRKKIISQK